METKAEGLADFGVEAGIVMVRSASRPIGESGKMVTTVSLAPSVFALAAIAARLAVAPEPEPMIKRSSAFIPGVTVSPTT